MNKRTVLVALLAGFTLAGCGGSDSPTAGPSAMAGGQAGIEVGGVAPLEALAPPVDLVAAPIATSTTRPAARTVAPATVKSKPAPVPASTTTTVAPVPVTTATTMKVVAPEPTTTTTTTAPMASELACAVTISAPVKPAAPIKETQYDQTATLTSNAPGRAFSFVIKRSVGPYAESSGKLVTDGAGGGSHTFAVYSSDGVRFSKVTVEAFFYGDNGYLLASRSCATTWQP